MTEKRELGDELYCKGSGWRCENHSQGVCTCEQVHEHLDAETTRALAAEARVKELEGRKCETCEQWLQELDGHKWADCRGILRSEGFDLDFADPEPRGQITVRTHKTFACNCWKKRGGE